MRQKTLNRLDRLQAQGGKAEVAMVLRLIESGAYYDELTEEQKAAYNRYRGFDAGYEALNAAYVACTGADPAEVRTRLEKNPTPEEQEAMRQELASFMDQLQAEYNSPEAVAQRKAEYEELRRIADLRRQDFYCGRDMDKCHPLPWK